METARRGGARGRLVDRQPVEEEGAGVGTTEPWTHFLDTDQDTPPSAPVAPHYVFLDFYANTMFFLKNVQHKRRKTSTETHLFF